MACAPSISKLEFKQKKIEEKTAIVVCLELHQPPTTLFESPSPYFTYPEMCDAYVLLSLVVPKYMLFDFFNSKFDDSCYYLKKFILI